MPIYIQDPPIKNQYRSTGIIRGIYLPSDTASAHGILITRDNMFSAELFRKWWQPPKEELVWNCWLKTMNHEPNLHFILKGTYRDEEGANIPPDLITEDRFSIRGNLLFWNEEKGNFAINIYPNKDALRKFKPFFVEIEGKLVNPKAGAFWEVEAVRKGNKLVLVEAQEIFPPIKKKKEQPKGKSKSKKPIKVQQKQANNSQQEASGSNQKTISNQDQNNQEKQLQSTGKSQEEKYQKKPNDTVKTS